MNTFTKDNKEIHFIPDSFVININEIELLKSTYSKGISKICDLKIMDIVNPYSIPFNSPKFHEIYECLIDLINTTNNRKFETNRIIDSKNGLR